MWKDSETEIDYLDFSYIVEIMKDTINDEKLLPSCIGLYGDWGSGKSSLMHMCKKQLEEQKDGTVCLLFNGWLYESYDDAKTAILASILDGIKECRELSGAAKITLKALYDSIDKFKVIKGGIKFGIDMAVTGGLGAITNLAIKEITKKAKKVAEDVDEETMLQAIKDKLDYKEVREDIREFREKFAELIEEAGIKKLVIFVDELDRCNPATILDTLEAMRLFLFSGNVSFVIGADERHVTYAIRSKFDDIEGINMDIGKEYQEKLIQYPIILRNQVSWIYNSNCEVHLLQEIIDEMYFQLDEQNIRSILNFHIDLIRLNLIRAELAGYSKVRFNRYDDLGMMVEGRIFDVSEWKDVTLKIYQKLSNEKKQELIRFLQRDINQEQDFYEQYCKECITDLIRVEIDCIFSEKREQKDFVKIFGQIIKDKHFNDFCSQIIRDKIIYWG